MMNEKLYRQFAADYCCLPEEAADRSNHFTEHAFLEGRRTWQEGPECFLKLAVFNSKLLFTGRKDIIEWCRNEFAESGPEWFLEAETLRRLDARLRPDGYQIDLIHLYYTTDRITPVNTDGYEIRVRRSNRSAATAGSARPMPSVKPLRTLSAYPPFLTGRSSGWPARAATVRSCSRSGSMSVPGTETRGSERC